MQYMIHTCPRRIKYVKFHLYPSMLRQGIKDDDILIYNDDMHKGTLAAYIDSIKQLDEEGGTWHIQDDVLLSATFRKQAETIRDHKAVVCGICTYYDFWQDETGVTTPYKMWYSFPCIYIPNYLFREFPEWVETTSSRQAREMKLAGRGIDALFKTFMQEEYSDYIVINSYPNLCDHIDHLIGGSVLQTQERVNKCTARYWEEKELNKELEEALKKDKITGVI